MSDTLFAIYKGLSQFVMPLGLAILGFLAAELLLHFGHRKSSRFLFIFTMAWLWLWSTPVWSDFVRGSLESKYSYKVPSEYPVADAIVVLGGGVRGYAGRKLPLIDLNRASDRELFAAELYRAGKAPRIILSGGADPVRRNITEAAAMRLFLIQLGVPAGNILIGTRSRNTLENQREVAEIVKQMKGKSILLVTSALHMQRAYWLFSLTGLRVIPAPTDYEVVNTHFSLAALLPDAEALENSSRAAREIIGLWLYKLGFN